jgi:hypothetical protein
MSLPVPSTAGGSQRLPHLDDKQMQAMDAPLIALTQQCNGDIRQLLFAFFSFLNRRTDFYLVPHPEDVTQGTPIRMGFAEGDAEKLLLAAFRQFPLRRIPKEAGVTSKPFTKPVKDYQNSQDRSKAVDVDVKTDSSATTRTLKKEHHSKESGSSSVKSVDSSDGKNTTNKSGGEGVVELPSEPQTPSNMDGVKYNDEGLQIPVGNGGSTPRYKWTQTLTETSVLIGIPKLLCGKDLDVVLTTSRICVKTKKPMPGHTLPQVLLEGDFVEKIRVDESTWTVEGGVMIVTLEKVQKKFWSTVVDGDEKIDTEMVDSRRHISDYDDATQAQIRKIIFDQNQFHNGLPSSDEIIGNKSDRIPSLPPGVEYIDKKRLDAAMEGEK